MRRYRGKQNKTEQNKRKKKHQQQQWKMFERGADVANFGANTRKRN